MSPAAPADATDTPDPADDGSARTRRGFLSTLGSVTAGVAALADPAAAATNGTDAGTNGTDAAPRHRVPHRQMRRAFHNEVDVITGAEIPVGAVRRTAHPDAEYVNVVPGVTFTRPQYEQFLSLFRRVLHDRTLSLVGDGFEVTGPHTSRASWVVCGTLPEGTRLCLPATGTHRWAPNGKCIRAEVAWLDPDATEAAVRSLAEHTSLPWRQRPDGDGRRVA